MLCAVCECECEYEDWDRSGWFYWLFLRRTLLDMNGRVILSETVELVNIFTDRSILDIWSTG